MASKSEVDLPAARVADDNIIGFGQETIEKTDASGKLLPEMVRSSCFILVVNVASLGT